MRKHKYQLAVQHVQHCGEKKDYYSTKVLQEKLEKECGANANYLKTFQNLVSLNQCTAQNYSHLKSKLCYWNNKDVSLYFTGELNLNEVKEKGNW